MNLSDIAKMYGIGRSTLSRYLHTHQDELNSLATRFTYKGRSIKRNELNRKQITLIVSIMQDPPEGYKLVRGILHKTKD